MANDISALIPKILAQGLLCLRENAVTPRIVANKSTLIAGKKGSTIDVPVSSAITAVAVAPAAYAPEAQDMAPDTVPVVLDQWYEAPFDLQDDEFEQAMDGVIPMQAAEAIKSIVNKVDISILSRYKQFYGYIGTAGTTPFATVADATGIRKILNKQLAPMDNRHVILDPDAEAAALGLTQFADMNFSGSVDAMRDGNLNRKVGMDWWMNQNIPTHTRGTLAGTPLVNGALSAGATTMNIDGSLTGTVVPGDVFTLASETQTRVVTNTTTLTASGSAVTGITFYPPLAAAVADNASVTFKASHVANLAIHRDAIAFASRPLIPAPAGLGVLSMAQQDPISGLTLRLEVTRQHKRTRWAYDLLWGVDVIRRELGMRIAG